MLDDVVEEMVIEVGPVSCCVVTDYILVQCVRTTIPDYTQLANHMPQYYIVSYSISMLMSATGSPKSLTLLHSLPLNFSLGGLLLFLVVGYGQFSLC